MLLYAHPSPGANASGMSATPATVSAGVAVFMGSNAGWSVKLAMPEVWPTRCSSVIALHASGQSST